MNSQIKVQAVDQDGPSHGRPDLAKPVESFAVDRSFSSWNRAHQFQSKLQESPGVSRTLKWLFLSVILVIFTGLVLYSWTIIPLESKLAAREAHSLAERIDSAVTVRAAVIRAASEDLNLAGLNSSGSLDAVRRTLRKAFPDFRSLEILNDEGDLLAMVGDVTLSGSLRNSVSGVPDHGEGEDEAFRPSFHDDPKGRSFFIEEAHRTTGGTRWFTRARFSRDTIERLLTSSKGPLHATLIKAPVTDGTLTAKDRDSANMSTDWQGNLAWIEAPLSVPGWWIRMESVPRQSDSSRLSLKAVALVLLALTVAMFVFWRNSISKRGSLEQASDSRSANFGDLQAYGSKEATTVGHAVQPFSTGRVAASSPSMEHDDSDDFFPNAKADELIRSGESTLRARQDSRKITSVRPSKLQALEEVFASPKFVEEFSEAPIHSVHDDSFKVPDFGESVPDGGAMIKPTASDAFPSDPGHTSTSGESLPKDSAGSSATAMVSSPEVDSVWAEPVDGEPVKDGPSDSPAADEDPTAIVSKAEATIPECLEVQWIEPAQDKSKTGSYPSQADSHRTA